MSNYRKSTCACVAVLLGLVEVSAAQTDAPSVPAFTISTVAGTGEYGYTGDGGPALEAQMNRPTAVALDSKGNLYIADMLNRVVRMVDLDGVITTVAGSGEGRPQKVDTTARETNLVQPYGIATDHLSNLYVLNRGHSKLHKISPDGSATTIAGTGRRGYNGDGVPAIEAQLAGSNHLVIDRAGNVIIADSANHRIRRIDSRGVISTIGGTGKEGYGGDGGPATAAQFAFPSAIAMDVNGTIYVADFGNHRIRAINPDGTATTIAGTGEPEYNGDNRHAIDANIGEPTGVAVDTFGHVFISDQVNNRIRVVIADGTIHTVAGTGERGYAGDGGLAHEALIQIPDILCTDADGNVYFPDHQNFVVRKLTRIGTRQP